MRRDTSYGKSFEDYLEAIYIMGLEGREVSVTGLAKRLNVKPSSVVEQLRRMSRERLVVYEKRGVIRLTERGEALAREVYRRHMLLKRFLSEILMVPEDIAERDACSMEHYLHRETLDKIEKFLSFMLEELSRDNSLLQSLRARYNSS